MTNTKPKVRGKSIKHQLQAALHEAENVQGLAGDDKRLIAARLVALGKLLNFGKLRKLKAENVALQGRVAELEAQVTALQSEKQTTQRDNPFAGLDARLKEIDQQYATKGEHAKNQL